MNPRIRRIVITGFVLGLALGMVLLMVLGPKPAPPGSGPAAASTPAPAAQTEVPDRPGDTPPDEGVATADMTEASEPLPLEADDPAEAEALETHAGLHVVPPPGGTPPPGPLGSLDPRQDKMLAELSLTGAGLERITLSQFWQTAAQSRQARAHYRALARGAPNPPPLPPDAERYVLQTALPYDWVDEAGAWQQINVPLLAANSVVLNGNRVSLLDATKPIWAEVSRADSRVTLEATIADEEQRPIARITRTWTLGDSYDLTCRQRITNLTDAPLTVQWIQYGPGDLIMDRSRYMDRRRFRFGYLPDPVNLPNLIASGNGDLLVEHGTATKRADKAGNTQDPVRRREYLSLWPNDSSRDNGFALSWFASTNRYFALVVHPVLDMTTSAAVTGSRSLESVVSDILLDVPPGPKGLRTVFTSLFSPVQTVAPGAETSFDLGVYAGPQDGTILREQEPMASLALKGLILYQMSAMCAICTFQWLAVGLLKFLSGVHLAIGDWGLAIILLVAVVRTLLHPLTKKAQVNMQRFGKAMGDLKPEIEKLQKKYPNDPKKLQQEQMRMMRERGVNPFQMLGCLPMFLQMPIWVALYAMLYFAFELRHEPAFWGFFQLFWDWPFLGDLSAADHCFWEFNEPFKFFIWNMTGINVLPPLMGVVFYIQQKYMSPPPSPSMTKEQLQQQKIMKVMMVVMFPVMLYSAPSGLTLYIFTSTLIGIIESRYVRAHIKAMDLEPPKKKQKKKKKPRDPQARMYADAIDRAKKKTRDKRTPPKKYKKRK